MSVVYNFCTQGTRIKKRNSCGPTVLFQGMKTLQMYAIQTLNTLNTTISKS